ncbi:MAG: TolC family protein [Lentimicrobiaceae bacterium]|nr:TolC family protein [Lentimicrobiaceae bacterium]
MKKISLAAIVFFFTGCFVSAQKINHITLDSCYLLAIEHNPTAQQSKLYQSVWELQESALNTHKLPQASLGGQVSWQSDVTSLPISLPNVQIPSLDKDSYKLYLDVNQLIWNGGIVQKQKELEKAGLLISLQTVEAENYRMKETVNQVYFSILLLQENEKLLKLSMSEIQSRLGKIRAGVANGTLLPSNAEVLEAEIIKTEQSITEVNHNKAAAIFRLSEITGIILDEQTEFEQPQFKDLPELNTRLRPEYQLLELQQHKLTAQQKITSLKVMPRISAFASLGYGKPGLNMLSNQFDTYAMVGARASWTLWNWNEHKKENSIIGIQKEIIETQKENFERNQRILLNNQHEEIVKNETLVAADFRIVKLRESVVKSSGAQLEQGTITSSEFLTEQNALTQVRINQTLHSIQLQYARLNYLSTMGLLK